MDLRENEMGLDEFGEFLLRRRLVPEKNAKFYVGWVRKFLGQGADPRLSLEERMAAFAEGLRQEGGREDWQIAQADRAVKMYFHTFRDGHGLEVQPVVARVERDAAGRVDAREVLEAARNLLRTKHYSYRTEQTYLGWIGQFFEYVGDSGAGIQEGARPKSATAKYANDAKSKETGGFPFAKATGDKSLGGGAANFRAPPSLR